MSSNTYYTVLGIPETATQEDVKRAYRNLIRQVHPDSVPNASPYWRRASEEKSKEINEAYGVLSDPHRRSGYDGQLARDRGSYESASSTWSGEVDAAPQHLSNVRRAPAVSQEGTRKTNYNLQSLKHWAGEYPVLAACLSVILLVPVVSLFPGWMHDRATARATDPFASDGFYSALPCLDPHATVSPIDGKPCPKADTTTTTSELPESGTTVQLTSPRWFYVTSNGIHPLRGVPDDETCKRFEAKSSVACESSLKFCPKGTLSKNCVSYSKWKKTNVGPPREEKPIPAWPSE